MKISQNKTTRRQFLRYTAGVALTALLPEEAYALIGSHSAHKELSFYNLHTEEKITVSYFEQGSYVGEALRDINYVLRDHRTNEVLAIDPKLLDLLYDLKNILATNQPIQIISAYRSPKTNAQLHQHSQGVAVKSLHMQGKAIDIRIQGISSAHIRNAVMSLARGGVGYYPHSNFVHIDTGAVRNWQGR